MGRRIRTLASGFRRYQEPKEKMRAALNIAVYYEMKDSLAKAEEWAEKAQQLAKNR